MATGTHEYVNDPRNAEILININGELYPRSEAKISVFDSGFILGDGVWEGIRLHHGRLAFIDKHMQRLFDGAKALDLDIGLSKSSLTSRMLEFQQSLIHSQLTEHTSRRCVPVRDR